MDLKLEKAYKMTLMRYAADEAAIRGIRLFEDVLNNSDINDFGSINAPAGHIKKNEKVANEYVS